MGVNEYKRIWINLYPFSYLFTSDFDTNNIRVTKVNTNTNYSDKS